MKTMAFAALAVLAAAGAASEDRCPAERPFHRGSAACDSCDWQVEMERYRNGELSSTRQSALLEHDVKVTVFCDAGRPVDVNDVFAQVEKAEAGFRSLFANTVDPEDGVGDVLEVVVGICDVGGGVDDCAMYEMCREVVRGGCDVASGISYRGPIPTTFVPLTQEGGHWWTDDNLYGNLLHEYVHLLDFAYLRTDGRRGPDTDWWVEGLAQYVQWKILDDDLSWERGNDKATLMGALTHQRGTRDYYDGMRVFAYMEENDPWMLERAASVVKRGVYSSPAVHLYWHDLLGDMAWRHQRDWEYWIGSVNERRSR